MRLLVFGVLVLFIAFGGAVPIGLSQVNRCICSDFTYFNDFNELSGNCRITSSSWLIFGADVPFCYVHQPDRCFDAVPSRRFSNMWISSVACDSFAPFTVDRTGQNQGVQDEDVQKDFWQSRSSRRHGTNSLWTERTLPNVVWRYRNSSFCYLTFLTSSIMPCKGAQHEELMLIRLKWNGREGQLTGVLFTFIFHCSGHERVW